MIPRPSVKIAESFFFGNYFYGCCAVALAIEASVQQRVPLNGPGFYLAIFLCTVSYYTFPYVRQCSYVTSNPRTNWYTRNYSLVRIRQWIYVSAITCLGIYFLSTKLYSIVSLSPGQWTLILVFPVLAMLYYGNSLVSGRYNLRRIGWLKPFVIGACWAGLVTIYPPVFHSIEGGSAFQFTHVTGLLFLKNLLFVAALCVMFDIKDCAGDYSRKLKTFVVGIGLRRTIFYILMPAGVAGLTCFIAYASAHGFGPIKVALNMLPFFLLMSVAWSLRRRRGLLYYLVAVDGLLLIKAICGTIAMVCFS